MIEDAGSIGPVLHWAHLLKIEQGPDGDWPLHINARTGEHIDSCRTRTPARLMQKLDALLNSTEYERCIARATKGAPS